MKTLFLSCSLLACCGFWAIGQNMQTVHLKNPSFEDTPSAGRAPSGWVDCGHAGESPPDIQPNGGFNVTKSAYKGSTYLGLVTRDNNTWERVAQRLSTPLRGGQCYQFSLSLACSDVYISSTRKNPNNLVNFDRGVTLRIWGGSAFCSYDELLATSPEVKHSDWKSYNLELNPTKNYKYICLEAYYKKPVFVPYNGNILVDNASDFSPCEEVVPAESSTALTENKDNDAIPKPTEEIFKDSLIPDPKQPQKISDANFHPAVSVTELEVGDIFQMENLRFQADSFNITPNSERVLFGLVSFLKEHPNITIEVGGHTNTLPPEAYCNYLSSERARKVAKYLVKNGIAQERISHKGYGKSQPIGEGKTTSAKRKNQRVEIKITGK